LLKKKESCVDKRGSGWCIVWEREKRVLFLRRTILLPRHKAANVICTSRYDEIKGREKPCSSWADLKSVVLMKIVVVGVVSVSSFGFV